MSLEADGRTSFVTALVGRGLSLDTFDGRVLTLNYNAAADRQIDKDKALESC